MAQGISRALADCGFTLKDVDGLFCAMTQQRMSIVSLIEYLGIQPKSIGSCMTGGSSFEFHVAQAAAAIEAGLCSVAVIGYGSTQRSVGRKQASQREVNPYETPFKPFLPTSAYALAASRHMHEFGTTREHLAAVAVAARQWAQLNPAAWEKKAADHRGRAEGAHDQLSALGARLLPGDRRRRRGHVDRRARAKTLKKPPAYVLGWATARRIEYLLDAGPDRHRRETIR